MGIYLKRPLTAAGGLLYHSLRRQQHNSARRLEVGVARSEEAPALVVVEPEELEVVDGQVS